MKGMRIEGLKTEGWCSLVIGVSRAGVKPRAISKGLVGFSFMGGHRDLRIPAKH